MERDGLLSHGATSCQKEKTFDHSDAYRTLFCKNCGTIANVKKITLRNPCQGERTNTIKHKLVMQYKQKTRGTRHT